MPQIIPLVVTAITAVTSAVVTAGPLAVAAFNAANIIGAAALANEAFKAVQPQVKSSSTAMEWNADPNAPNRFAFGRIGGPGNIIHNATYGPDKMFVGFVGVMSASGPIKSWQAFKADDAFVSFNTAGMAINTEYANEMYLGRQRGLQPEPSYLPSPSGLKNGAAMPRWGASYKLSGKAAYIYTLAENSKRSAFKGKVPTGVHFIEGLYCYDPRLDSTFPGGTGPCRIDDPTTWVYSTNAYIHALNWNIGRWEGEARGFTPARYGVPYASMKVGGIGATLEGIDFSGYVEAANVFDENAWACAAWPDADQSKAAVLDSFLQAGGGIYAERQGKISCLHRAAPRTSIITITADDTAGTIEYDTTTSLLERINTIRPEYWSEAHGWQMVATDEVTSNVWREEDGQGVAVTRSKGLAYNYVPGSKQARELAALQVAHTREGIRGTVPLRHYLDLDVGDCFTFEVPEAVLNGQKCIVLNVDPDLENDIIHVTFASESDGKYAFAFGQADAPPPAPALMPSSNEVTPPLPEDWVIVPRPPAPGGVVPGFDLSGVVGNATATAIEVRYWVVPTDGDPEDEPGPDAVGWVSAGTWPPTASSIPIDVEGGRHYWLGLIYIRNQNSSDMSVMGPYLAEKLIAGGLTDEASAALLEEAMREVDEKVADAAELVRDAVNLDELFGQGDDLAESILKLGRGLLDVQSMVDRLGRVEGLPVGVVLRQEVAILDEADRQEALARTTLGAVLGGNIAAAESAISAVATNLGIEVDAREILAGRVGTNEGAIVTERNLRIAGDSAEASARSALAVVVSNNKAAAENSISALATDLGAEVTARGLLAVRVASAEGAITTEQSVRANADGVFTTNFSLLGARRGNNSGWVLNKATVDITDEGTLATVLSGLRATDGTNSSAITALQSASSTQASSLLSLTSTVGDHTSSISSLFNVTNGLGARWTVQLNSGNQITGLVADGATRSWVFSGANFSVVDDGNGLSYTPATGRLKIVKGSKKTVLGASSGLILWAGNTSVGDGAETIDNGDLGIGSGDAWFGGRTLSGPFDTGAGSSSSITLGTTWTEVASFSSITTRSGQLLSQPVWEAYGAAPEFEGWLLEWRIVTTNLSGGDLIEVQSGSQTNFNSTAWTASARTVWQSFPTNVSGQRLIKLQMRRAGGISIAVRNVQLRGFHGN